MHFTLTVIKHWIRTVRLLLANWLTGCGCEFCMERQDHTISAVMQIWLIAKGAKLSNRLTDQELAIIGASLRKIERNVHCAQNLNIDGD